MSIVSSSSTVDSDTVSVISFQDGETKLDELEIIYDNILKTTNQVHRLRKLFFKLNCSAFQQKLPDEVAHALVGTLCDHSSSSQVGNLCILILLEASPLTTLQLDDLLYNFDQKSLLKLLTILPLQDEQMWENSQLISRCIDILKETLSVDDHVAVLNFIKNSICYGNVKLSKDSIDFLNSHFVFILHHASIYQSSNPYMSTLFRRSDISAMKVRELDDRPAQEFFTILNWAQYNTDDQFANICGFSLVKRWLNTTVTMTDILLPSSYTLLKKVCEYCVQVMDQACHLASKPDDVALQKAALLEALTCLDFICLLQPSFTHSVFHSVRQFLPKYSADVINKPHNTIVFISIMQFFLHHGESMAFDVESILRDFFISHVSQMYWDTSVAFEYVQFLQDNVKALTEKHNWFVQFFPCIFKIPAWHPITFLEEFVEILPICVCKNSVIEVFHLLLDLPCLTATLMVDALRPNMIPTPAIDALRNTLNNDVQYKPMVTFMMRNESGKGDTFNRLNVYHQLLQPVVKELRVVRCAELSPVLLEVYFQKIFDMDEETVFLQLIPVMLERVNLVYNVPKFPEIIEKTMADMLIHIFKHRPSLAIKLNTELMEFIQFHTNMRKSKLFYTHILFIIGEYSSTTFNEDCTSELLSSIYNELECLMYEVLSTIQSNPLDLKIVTILATAMAKIATRSQDLIPRVTLCMSKVNHHISSPTLPYAEEELEVVGNRIQRLTLVLRKPNVASVLLNPPLDIEDQSPHTNPFSIPFVLKSICPLLSKDANE